MLPVRPPGAVPPRGGGGLDIPAGGMVLEEVRRRANRRRFQLLNGYGFCDDDNALQETGLAQASVPSAAAAPAGQVIGASAGPGWQHKALMDDRCADDGGDTDEEWERERHTGGREADGGRGRKRRAGASSARAAAGAEVLGLNRGPAHIGGPRRMPGAGWRDEQDEQMGQWPGHDPRSLWAGPGFRPGAGSGSSLVPLIQEAVAASSTDHPTQHIGHTCYDNREFWSSSGTLTGRPISTLQGPRPGAVSGSPHADDGGHPDDVAEDWLLYRLASPCCRVAYVQVAVYRALYQHGEPIYPPQAISVWLGPSPTQLYRASPKYRISPTDRDQVLPVWSSSPGAGYMLLRLHGRLQRQLQDMQYYTAMRYVAAVGQVLSPHDVCQVVKALPGSGLLWPGTAGGKPQGGLETKRLLADVKSVKDQAGEAAGGGASVGSKGGLMAADGGSAAAAAGAGVGVGAEGSATGGSGAALASSGMRGRGAGEVWDGGAGCGSAPAAALVRSVAWEQELQEVTVRYLRHGRGGRRRRGGCDRMDTGRGRAAALRGGGGGLGGGDPGEAPSEVKELLIVAMDGSGGGGAGPGGRGQVAGPGAGAGARAVDGTVVRRGLSSGGSGGDGDGSGGKAAAAAAARAASRAVLNASWGFGGALLRLRRLVALTRPASVSSAPIEEAGLTGEQLEALDPHPNDLMHVIAKRLSSDEAVALGASADDCMNILAQLLHQDPEAAARPQVQVVVSALQQELLQRMRHQGGHSQGSAGQGSSGQGAAGQGKGVRGAVGGGKAREAPGGGRRVRCYGDGRLCDERILSGCQEEDGREMKLWRAAVARGRGWSSNSGDTDSDGEGGKGTKKAEGSQEARKEPSQVLGTGAGVDGGTQVGGAGEKQNGAGGSGGGAGGDVGWGRSSLNRLGESCGGGQQEEDGEGEEGVSHGAVWVDAEAMSGGSGSEGSGGFRSAEGTDEAGSIDGGAIENDSDVASEEELDDEEEEEEEGAWVRRAALHFAARAGAGVLGGGRAWGGQGQARNPSERVGSSAVHLLVQSRYAKGVQRVYHGAPFFASQHRTGAGQGRGAEETACVQPGAVGDDAAGVSHSGWLVDEYDVL